MILGWIATVTIMPVYLALPTLAPRRPFVPESAAGRLLAWERGTYLPIAAFPSFHVIWALLIADLASGRGRIQAWAWRAWAWAIGVACVTTGMHAVVDIAGALVVGAALLQYERAWGATRRLTERAANSWREWRVGPVRLISHGVYAGLGTFAGLVIVSALVGVEHWRPILATAVLVLVSSALWAQWIEGSPRLLRLYGFYGGVAGVILGALVAPLVGTSGWLLLGGYAVAAPVVQAC